MSAKSSQPRARQAPAWTDVRLVRGCLKGDDQAWSALVDKYKNLIYSIPIKYGLAPDAASDIFQSVCLEALSQLSNLREPRALPKWLMQVTAHKCYHWMRLQARSEPLDENEEPVKPGATPPGAEDLLREAEQDQLLRDAIAALPPRCAELVRMLFFEQPPLPYAEIARKLGIATGSVGFIRGRCLKRLRTHLESAGRK